MLCKWCGIKEAGEEDHCEDCEKQYDEDIERIDDLCDKGHTQHCACRQVWGDGECSCELEKHYDPYWWIKEYSAVPFTTA